jgi:hypothetical protein
LDDDHGAAALIGGAIVYTFVRRADAQTLEAMIFAVEISQIVKKASGLDVILNTQAFGPSNRVYWVVRGIESLDDFQKKQALLLADSDYMSKVGEAVAGEYFIPGSFEDMLLQSVDM